MNGVIATLTKGLDDAAAVGLPPVAICRRSGRSWPRPSPSPGGASAASSSSVRACTVWRAASCARGISAGCHSNASAHCNDTAGDCSPSGLANCSDAPRGQKDIPARSACRSNAPRSARGCSGVVSWASQRTASSEPMRYAASETTANTRPDQSPRASTARAVAPIRFAVPILDGVETFKASLGSFWNGWRRAPSCWGEGRRPSRSRHQRWRDLEGLARLSMHRIGICLRAFCAVPASPGKSSPPSAEGWAGARPLRCAPRSRLPARSAPLHARRCHAHPTVHRPEVLGR